MPIQIKIFKNNMFITISTIQPTMPNNTFRIPKTAQYLQKHYSFFQNKEEFTNLNSIYTGFCRTKYFLLHVQNCYTCDLHNIEVIYIASFSGF